jgi:hypothetical protein
MYKGQISSDFDLGSGLVHKKQEALFGLRIEITSK